MTRCRRHRSYAPRLAMWHGEPYAEFADEDWVRVEAQRLQELRLVAYERLVDAELACGVRRRRSPSSNGWSPSIPCVTDSASG